MFVCITFLWHAYCIFTVFIVCLSHCIPYASASACYMLLCCMLCLYLLYVVCYVFAILVTYVLLCSIILGMYFLYIFLTGWQLTSCQETAIKKICLANTGTFTACEHICTRCCDTRNTTDTLYMRMKDLISMVKTDCILTCGGEEV